LAVRFFQILLLVVGAVWAIFICDGRFDETQIPGFLIALSISWWLTPEIRARALRLGLVDQPGEERRIHKLPVPRLGGVAIYISVMLTIAILVAMTGRFPKNARVGEGGLAGIALGGTLIFILGLIDDLESLPAKLKLVVQTLAACAAYSLGVRIKTIPLSCNIPGLFTAHSGILSGLSNFCGLGTHTNSAIDLGIWSLPLTVVWLVGMSNAVNLIDGMDGLAAGVSAISALTIWTVAMAESIDRPYAALTAAVLAGALLGFLRWNFNPARIFLGDSGAYLTGFILGAVSITGVIKGAAAATLIVPTFLLVILILFFPLLDTFWAVIRRTAQGKSIFTPDSDHIHHRLLKAGFSQKSVAYLLYGFSALFGLIAATLVGQQVYFLMLAGAVLLMAGFFSEVLNRHRQRNKPGKEKAIEAEKN
jgi:UDP-GlcNAc:undecaprenyl-phosphate/decaprenyl-phosphate GlcNAc-1-phosphate transferase